jgi:tetratricopeptide (TPR) repeat protein/TolB-like protein
MAHDVFISHSHQDKPVADAICVGLEDAGFQCWIAPRDIMPGSEWGEAIVEAISAARVMIVVFSTHSNASKQVLREVERSVSHNVTVVPVRIDDVTPTGSMEYFLGTPHWLDAMTPPLERHIQRLVVTVGTILRKPTQAKPTPARSIEPAAATPRRRFEWLSRQARMGAAAVLVVALAIAGVFVARGRAATDPNNDVVAVLPFHVTANDPAVADLREGMMDLLHDKFPRAVPVMTVLHEWQQAGGHGNVDLTQDVDLQVARRVHAGRFVVGSVLRTPQGIRMTASLHDAHGGEQRGSATAEGPQSSYPALIDTLAIRLMSQQAGEEQHLYLLSKIPTAAVSAYVSGKKSYRAGRYDDAVTFFERALDSSRIGGPDSESRFGLAALGLVSASNYQQIQTETAERGLRIAWTVRDELHPADRALLDAIAGPDYPAVSTRRAQMAAWDNALNALPDVPEAYYQFGDQLFRYGQFVQWDEPLKLSRRMLEEALRRDSTFIPALERLAELSIGAGDLAQADQLLRRIPDGDTATDRAAFLRWRLAVARNDGSTLRDIRSRFAHLSQQSAREIWLTAQVNGVAMEDVEPALNSLEQHTARREDRASVAGGRYLLAMNEGRPRAAVEQLRRSVPEDQPYFTPLMQGQELRDAIFGSGDANTAAQALDQLSVAMRDGRENPAPTPADKAAEYVGRCAVEEWRLAHRSADSAAATARRLREILPAIQPARFGGASTVVAGAEPVCPAAIDAWAATIQKRPDAGTLVEKLDTLMSHGPMDADGTIGNELVARLQLERGDSAAALRTLRRRAAALSGLFYLAPSLRTEGQLAAALGDRDGAIAAYTHYLALRRNPEPALTAEVDETRKALDRLRILAQRN